MKWFKFNRFSISLAFFTPYASRFEDVFFLFYILYWLSIDVFDVIDLMLLLLLLPAVLFIFQLHRSPHLTKIRLDSMERKEGEKNRLIDMEWVSVQQRRRSKRIDLFEGNSENIGWWNGSNKKKLVELFFFLSMWKWLDGWCSCYSDSIHTHTNFQCMSTFCFYANDREWEREYFRALALWHLRQEWGEGSQRYKGSFLWKIEK